MRHSQKSLYLILGVAIASLVLLFSCSDSSDPIDEPDNTPDLKPLAQVEKEVVSSANNFSFDIFSRINTSHPNDNIFISPFSISTALSMTLNGAAGATKDSIKMAIGLDEIADEQVNEAYKNLVATLLTMDNKVAIEVANSNWYKDSYSINQEFEQILLDYYDAEVKAADFGDPATLDLINGWIEDKTHDKIKDMLDEIPADAVMYLINAIYFKADWAYQFDASKTQNRDFYLQDNSSVSVPTMYSEGVNLGMHFGEDYQLYDLPYGNGQFSFTIVRPGWNSTSSLDEMIESLTVQQLENLLADTTHSTIEVYMPKFKIEFKKLLNEVLMDMGMRIAFENADFSNLFEEDLSLAISRVIHQSFLEVNEEGSEAAAATIVEIIETSAGPPTVLYLNQPFLFFIRENHTNTILFSGKLVDPR